MTSLYLDRPLRSYLQALADRARPLNDEDYAFDRQVEAENEFCDAVAAILSPVQMAHWQAWSLKATSNEIIEEGLRLAELALST